MFRLFRRSFKTMFFAVSALALAVMLPAAQTPPKKIDPCALLTKAEIQEVFGQPVGDGKPNAAANPAVGAPCQYKVGDYGSFSILVKPLGPGETPDKIQSMLGKMMKTADAPGIGDKSFFSFPGYGMVQLNTFKGPYYLIITLMVSGLTEDGQKAPAEKLMKKILPKL